MRDRCPRCAGSFDAGTASETLRSCPFCRTSFLTPLPNHVSIVTSTGPDTPPVVSQVELPESFRSRYTLGEVLGVGASGTVYAARTVEGDPVAVKFLTGEAFPQVRERFLQEGRLLTQIRDPHVVRVLDTGDLPGHTYLVCELVAGGTLRDRLKNSGALGLCEAIGHAIQLLLALEACHARGIIHRDIKPENIMLTPAGQLKLMDLGVARDTHRTEPRLTQTGALVGTPRYMAPEQLRAQPPRPQADLWAVGVTLYEMLAGAPPFSAQSFAELVFQVEASDPLPLGERVVVPAALADLVHELLCKDPEKRPSRAEEVRERLERILEECRVARLPGPRGRVTSALTTRVAAVPGALPAALLGVLLAGAAMGLVARVRSGHPSGSGGPGGGSRPVLRQEGGVPIACGGVSGQVMVFRSTRDQAEMVLVPAPRRLRPFFMDRCEVTNEQFQRYLEATGDRREAPREDPMSELPGWSRRPVVEVSLADARAYCRWAGKRLPAREEWEWAARGGIDGKRYPWGNEDPAGRACYGGPERGRPVPVGSFPANGFGLLDMSGNVAEWSAPGARDPGPETVFVALGGSWSSPAGGISCDAAATRASGDGRPDTGFRCVVGEEAATVSP